MLTALLTFTRLLALALGLWCAYLVAATTLGRWLETPAERVRDIIYGRAWRSRTGPALGLFVCAAWLYATWGI